MLMFSIMWLAPVWYRALMWSWATPVSPSRVRDSSYQTNTHQISFNQRTRNGTVYKGEKRIDSKRDQPAASLQSQMCVHLMRWSLCWVCRGRERPPWRLETHTDTSPWDISSLGLWHPESSLWNQEDKSTMRRRDRHHQSADVSVGWLKRSARTKRTVCHMANKHKPKNMAIWEYMLTVSHWTCEASIHFVV